MLSPAEPPLPEVWLCVDYGLTWPLSDVMWEEQDRPDWNELLGQNIVDRLTTLAAFFTRHADEETGTFGSEDLRKWFDLESVSLFNELEDRVGHIYKVRLKLWF